MFFLSLHSSCSKIRFFLRYLFFMYILFELCWVNCDYHRLNHVHVPFHRLFAMLFTTELYLWYSVSVSVISSVYGAIPCVEYFHMSYILLTYIKMSIADKNTVRSVSNYMMRLAKKIRCHEITKCNSKYCK